MPLVRIEMIKGKSAEYKKQVLECVHAGLEEALGIPDWDRSSALLKFRVRTLRQHRKNLTIL